MLLNRCAMILMSSVLALGFWAGASGTVLHVPSEYPTIQAGINAAMEGDTVLVADGTYTGDGNRDLNFGGVNMVVMSEYGPEATIIDCEGSPVGPHRGFCFYSGEDSTSVVQGFTITNGYIVGGTGGGIDCQNSSPTIVGNTITGNSAGNIGGGILGSPSDAAIIGNTIRGNTAALGGGIFLGPSSGSIESNLITGNTAWNLGGGICVGAFYGNIVGNTMAGNTAVNFGGAIYCDTSSAVVLNCILWGDSAATGREIYLAGGSSIIVSYSDVEGGWPGEGNIDADPLFVTGPQGDYYLSQFMGGQPQESPCVDAGDSGSPVPEGTTRTDEVCDVWPVDMGYHYYPCTPSLLWVQVTPDTTLIPRGEDLWFAVDIVNNTDTTVVFDAWVDGYLFNGNPYAGNPVLGPVVVGLGGGQGLYGVRRHVTIPWGAPFGSPYRLCIRTGEHPDSIWAEDCFDFAVVPPPLEQNTPTLLKGDHGAD